MTTLEEILAAKRSLEKATLPQTCDGSRLLHLNQKTWGMIRRKVRREMEKKVRRDKRKSERREFASANAARATESSMMRGRINR